MPTTTSKIVRDHTQRGRWRRIRRKDDTATADQAWYDLQVDPDSCVVTIAGTASDGNYQIIFTPAPSTLAAAITITVVRATTPASNTDLAAAMVVAINAQTVEGGTLYGIVRTSSNVAGAVTIFWDSESRYRWIVTTAESTATGTITLTGPDDQFPITRAVSPIRGADMGWPSALEFVLIPVSSTDVPLPDDTDMTHDVRVMDVVDRWSTGLGANDPDPPVGVGRSAIYSAVSVGLVMRVPYNGGRYGFWLSAATNPVTSLDATEVWAREVVD